MWGAFARHYQRSFNILFLLVIVLFLGGCGLGAEPDDLHLDGDSFAEAHRGDTGSSQRARFAVSAEFNPVTNSISIRTGRTDVRIVAVSTQFNQLLGVLANNNVGIRSSDDDDDDDDDRRSATPLNLFLNSNVVPSCLSLQLTTRRGRVFVDDSVPVRNAPNGTGCVGAASSDTLQITRARWKASEGRLKVEGFRAVPNGLVTLSNAQTGDVLATDQAYSSGSWKIVLNNLVTPPCAVTVVSGNFQATRPVSGVQGLCTGQANVGGPTSTDNIPDAAIITPAGTSSSILVGQTISFRGVATYASTGAEVVGARFMWNFDGAQANSEQQNPVVSFNAAGVYRISLRVWDANNVADPTPATHVVTVSSSQVSARPSVEITTPADPVVTISAGQTVTFISRGAVGPGQVDRPLQYVWDFGGGANNTSLQNPGPVQFNVPGTYQVTVVSIDANNGSSLPDERTIVVLDTNTNQPVGQNNPPAGQILSPVASVQAIEIQRGTAISFRATGSDPDGDALNYRWTFDGAANDSSLQNPTVTFNQAGVYVVMMTVTDARGLADPVPQFRVIAVTDSTTGGGGNTGATTAVDLMPRILTPTGDRSIVAGQSLNFTGDLQNPAQATGDVVYMWDFEDAAHGTTVQNPGEVSFDEPGVYRVTLVARDASGATGRTVAERIITVNQSGVSLPPRVSIATPTQSTQTINLGTSLNFTGLDNNNVATSGGTLSGYEWFMDGAAEDSTQLSPGSVTFNQVGTYNIRFRARNSQGISTPIERVTVNVTEPANAAGNQAPSARIVAPLTDMTIIAGDQIDFRGAGSDANGNSLSYNWTFESGSPASSTIADPGLVTFNTPGVWHVDLRVTDSTGLSAPVHATRRIRVLSNTGTAPTVSILASPNSTTVSQGSTMNLTANVSGVSNTNGYDFHWDLDGIANDVDGRQTQIRFDRAGTYRIKLRTITSQYVEAAVVERVITVTPSGTASNTAPQVSVSLPSNNQTIAIGQALDLSATVTDNDNNYPLTQRWTFDGGASGVILTRSSANSANPTPGQVTFKRAGTYTVIVTATDATGRQSVSVPRTITVTGANTNTGNNNNNSGTNAVARIVAPTTSTQVRWGGTLNLQAAVDNAESGVSYSYFWELESFAPDQAGQNVSATVPLPTNTNDRITVYRRVILNVRDSNGNSLDPVYVTVRIDP